MPLPYLTCMLEGVANNQTDELVVGEGVALLIPPASALVRIMCGIVDVIVYVLASVAIFLLFPTFGSSFDAAQVKSILILLVACTTVIFPATVESLTHGKSLGKLIGGMRVVRIDSGPIVWRQSLTRALIGVVEIWGFGVLSVVFVLFNKRSRRLGDIAAGTYVINERRPLRIPSPPAMPAHLEAWARSTDLGGISPALAISMRQFLARKNLLTSEGGSALAGQLMRQVHQAVLPRPPQAPPEQIISALLAERTRRETERLNAEETMRERVLAD
ncbi:hypothetical protein HMPREF3152_04985 [Actinomyces sp. HMSC06A08]|nr:RDD family protein [Winkia neuii]OFJ71383.1 hypothetical protein HMPREF2851_07560 [Actinomyces sp. HMSC064C12]OFT55430.1 hypothetical protein HMPREF3152_04985 [Actinomyces sp. HMSC06A08]